MLSLGLVLVLAPSPAQADDQPAILKAYGLDWIERVREEAWPQPKAQRPVICLLDTGVAVTPDTPADNPEGPIVARLSVEDPLPGSETTRPGDDLSTLGLPQGDTFAHFHGTRMASLIGAPRNGYGTVGVFPQARIVSVRVTQQDDVYITPANVLTGVRLCRIWTYANGARASAVVMAESLYKQRVEDRSFWLSASSVASSMGATFVVAAGNANSAEPVVPAETSGVLIVGAGDDLGNPCAEFPTPAIANVLVAPGCSKNAPGLWPGSSSATALVGGVIAALVTRSPSATAADAAAAVTHSAASGWLQGAALTASFAGLIGSPEAVSGKPSELLVTREAPAVTREAAVRLWRPGVRLSRRGARLTIVRTSRRAGVLCVRWTGRAEPVRVKSRKTSLVIGRRTTRVELWAESADGTSWRSLSSRVRVPK